MDISENVLFLACVCGCQCGFVVCSVLGDKQKGRGVAWEIVEKYGSSCVD